MGKYENKRKEKYERREMEERKGGRGWGRCVYMPSGQASAPNYTPGLFFLNLGLK